MKQLLTPIGKTELSMNNVYFTIHSLILHDYQMKSKHYARIEQNR